MQRAHGRLLEDGRSWIMYAVLKVQEERELLYRERGYSSFFALGRKAAQVSGLSHSAKIFPTDICSVIVWKALDKLRFPYIKKCDTINLYRGK